MLSGAIPFYSCNNTKTVSRFVNKFVKIVSRKLVKKKHKNGAASRFFLLNLQ